MRLVWVVEPKAHTVTMHPPNAVPHVLSMDDVLDGGDVVPGFSCPVRRMFE